MMKRYNDSVKELAKQFNECSEEFNQYTNCYDVLWKDKTLYLSWLPKEIYECILNNLYIYDCSEIYDFKDKFEKIIYKINDLQDSRYGIIIRANGEYNGLYGTFGYFINYNMIYKYMDLLNEHHEDYEISFEEIEYKKIGECEKYYIRRYGCYLPYNLINDGINEADIKNE